MNERASDATGFGLEHALTGGHPGLCTVDSHFLTCKMGIIPTSESFSMLGLYVTTIMHAKKRPLSELLIPSPVFG